METVPLHMGKFSFAHYHQCRIQVIIISARFRIWLHGDVNWENRSNLYPGELESRIFVNIDNFDASFESASLKD